MDLGDPSYRAKSSTTDRRCSGAALAPLASLVQVLRTDLTGPQELEPLGEDLLQLGDRTPLAQHVPVGARRTLGLGLGLDPVDLKRHASAARAFPLGRDDSVVGHHNHKMMSACAVVADLLSWSHLNPTLILEALCSQPRAA